MPRLTERISMTMHPGIPAPLAEAMANKNYTTLTPVQELVVDVELNGRDLLVSAQTGSGKTVAFGLALAPALLAGEDRLPPATAPLALIITPTRELALQVTRELSWLYAQAGGRIASCIGGMDIRDERRALERGVHIVVGTPGRLADHVKRGSLDLASLSAVVLDEADEMLDMGFREELELILTAAPETRRTLMFSATVSKQIARLTEKFQTDAVRLDTASSKTPHVDIQYLALPVAPSEVEHAVINLLLFYDAQTAIVFCSRRETVNKLSARLTNRGFSVVALSGEFSQKERTNSLQAMRDGRARVCVATDVAARGLDLPGLDLVIHADLPQNKEALLHRSGRTGRAGRKGVSALIVPVRARRRMERLLQDSGVSANWENPPTVADISARLDSRVLASPVLQDPVSDAEAELVAKLLQRYGAEQVAAAFVRHSRERQSAPEDLQPVTAERVRIEKSAARADFSDGKWIVLSVGRQSNADPKWLLPMLCKAGGFQRDEIGAIRIGQSLTHVELRPDAAEVLLKKAGPSGRIDKSLTVQRASGPPTSTEAHPHADQKRGKRHTKGKGPERKRPAKFKPTQTHRGGDKETDRTKKPKPAKQYQKHKGKKAPK